MVCTCLSIAAKFAVGVGAAFEEAVLEARWKGAYGSFASTIAVKVSVKATYSAAFDAMLEIIFKARCGLKFDCGVVKRIILDGCGTMGIELESF